MNSTKIIFAIALIAFCCISESFSVRCYVCNSKDSCKKPQLYQCDPTLANATRSYLSMYHTGVPNATSPYYECFSEYIQNTANAEFYYKGCTYANIHGCKLPLSYAIGATKKHECIQCTGKDGCNPAGRANVNVISVFATIMVAVILRYIWH